MKQTENRQASLGSPSESVLGEPSRAGEDPRIAQTLEEYLAALEAGQQPNRQEFLSRYAEIAEPLAECMDGLEFVNSAAPQVDLSLLQQVSGASAAAGAAPVTGCLGDFRLFHEIGRGGMGVVYEAEQVSLGRRVALKVLPFAAALDAKQLQRFKNEAQAAAQLHHTNIVPVYAVGCERGVHYYAMQFIDGQTLAKVIADWRTQHAQVPQRGDQHAAKPVPPPTGEYHPAASVPPPVVARSPDRATIREPPSPIPPTRPIAGLSTEHAIQSAAHCRTVAHLGVQAALALEHAHQLGVVHRDIKPANLLLDVRGNLWITDFGLAHCQSQAGLTMSGDLVGTLRYMSPEQALGKRALLDQRTDVYSLGVTLYELLTLQPAFNGSDREALLRQITFEEPRQPRRLNKGIPVELETIVLKAMEKSPEARYASAQELADDLRRLLENKPIQARRPTLVQRASKWCRRNPLLASALAVIAAILVLGSAVAWLLAAWALAEKGRAADQAGEAERQRQAALARIIHQAHFH
jgi:serine/threonine protein kinase